jgi:hypothetical protein
MGGWCGWLKALCGVYGVLHMHVREQTVACGQAVPVL